MAVVLYKEGDTHEERGIKCSIERFEVKDMVEALKSGYVVDPKELNKKEPKKETKKKAK